MLESQSTNEKTIDNKPRDFNNTLHSNAKSLQKKELKRTCNQCDDMFSKFTELELHIKEEHANYKEQECDECTMNFVTSWRLKKHKRINLQKVTKICY